MNRERCCNQEGYQQGFCDGKRTGGKIKKQYIENLFKCETHNLSNEESLQFKMGWQDGFSDAVRGTLKKMVLGENCLQKELDVF